jgi:hypothetical protein
MQDKREEASDETKQWVGTFFTDVSANLISQNELGQQLPLVVGSDQRQLDDANKIGEHPSSAVPASTGEHSSSVVPASTEGVLTGTVTPTLAECMDPDILADYPKTFNVMKVTRNWNPDDAHIRPDFVYDSLCHFDYSDKV